MASALHLAALSQVSAQPLVLQMAWQVMLAAHVQFASVHVHPTPLQIVGREEAAPQAWKDAASAATTNSRGRPDLRFVIGRSRFVEDAGT
jgi:hypothetical protein